MNNQPNNSLPQQLKDTAAFLEPENLAELILKYEGEVALLVIDVQKGFCDPAVWLSFGTAAMTNVGSLRKTIVAVPWAVAVPTSARPIEVIS